MSVSFLNLMVGDNFKVSYHLPTVYKKRVKHPQGPRVLAYIRRLTIFMRELIFIILDTCVAPFSSNVRYDICLYSNLNLRLHASKQHEEAKE